MDIYSEEGAKVVYTGCTDAQVSWGSCDDPRGVLKEGQTYTVERTDVHGFHTKVFIKGVECPKGRGFNSVCFEDVA